MDRRVLMAALLMIVILAVYQHFAPPPPRPAHKASAADSAAALARGDTSGATGALSGAGTPAGAGLAAGDAEAWGVPGLTEHEITVDTPLYSAVFSTRGARVTSWKLKKFAGPNGEAWVELVPPDSDGGLNLLLDTPTGKIDLSKAQFRSAESSLHLDPGHPSGTVTMEAPGPGGATLREVFAFSQDSYSFGVDLQVLDAQGAPYRGPERPTYVWYPGLDLTEQDVESEVQRLGAVASLPGDRMFRATMQHFRKSPELQTHASANWAALRNKYFLLAMVPRRPGDLEVGFSGDAERGRISMIAGLPALAELSGPAGPASGAHPGDMEVYIGPMDYGILRGYGRGLENAVDLGWRWLSPLSRFTHWLLVQIHRGVPNWGLAIILLAALAKLLFQPLTHQSVKSMRAMQRIQPQLNELREKHKSDPQRQQREMMKLYKEAGVNPMSGCLPLLIQSPVFMALFNVLQHAIELRQARFIFWIKDLSSQDALFALPFALPVLGHKVNLLPIIMGVCMYWQQKTATPSGATADPRSQLMGYMMPPMFTIMFYRFPSGLVIYWIVNTVLTIAHQYYLNRGELEKAAGEVPAPRKRRRRRGGPPAAGSGDGNGSQPAVPAGRSSSE